LDTLILNEAMLVDGTPKPKRSIRDLHHDFVEMPDIAGSASPSLQILGDLWPEFNPPTPDGFV